MTWAKKYKQKKSQRVETKSLTLIKLENVLRQFLKVLSSNKTDLENRENMEKWAAFLGFGSLPKILKSK